MWYEISYDLLYEDVYISFINECILRSDAMSLEIYWPSDDFRFFNKEECLSIGMSEALYESRYKHELKKYLKDKQLFENNCIPFLQKLKEHLVNHKNFESKLNKYKFFVSQNISQYLLEPKSLSNWGFPNYPDNICFYVDDEPWFVCTNHGQSNASIKINSKDDYDYWQNLGLFFFDSYHSEI